MKVKEALVWGAKLLREADVEDARFEAEVLLRHVLSTSRAQLYTEGNEPLPQEKQGRYTALLFRRERGEPTAYLTGQKEFYGLDLLVDPRVLVPRPETELLVDLALKHLEDRDAPRLSCRVADIGTGSGALAIALAINLPDAEVHATDISPKALEVAAANCCSHGVEDRVRLLHSDLLDPLPAPVDVLVCNPPYVPTAEMPALPGEIREHEPAVALDGGPDGLDVVRRLLPQARGNLKPGGASFVEIGYGQAAHVSQLARNLFAGAEIELVKDLSGIERVLAIYAPATPELEFIDAGVEAITGYQ
ncbi:MAG: peptide chain release factor N(5)-glutamine methyltransferase [Dehalococcoidia bacterium]